MASAASYSAASELINPTSTGCGPVIGDPIRLLLVPVAPVVKLEFGFRIEPRFLAALFALTGVDPAVPPQAHLSPDKLLRVALNPVAF